MGRHITILKCDIYDDDQGENPLVVDQKDLEYLGDRYQTDENVWKFDDDGSISFARPELISGEPEDWIRALLTIAKKYQRRIAGTFSYDDDQTGGSYHCLVYISKNYTAAIVRYNTDIKLETIAVPQAHVDHIMIVPTETSYPYPGFKTTSITSPTIPCDFK